jgi:hypothetical protein
MYINQRRNRLIAVVRAVLLGVGITLGPSGLLVARETECVWKICVSNALIYGLGSVVTFVIGLWLVLEFWLRE